MKQALIIILALLVLGSCNPQKRAVRLLKRAERLDPKLFQDSVLIRTQYDTIWKEVPPVEFIREIVKNDTVVLYDTIYDVKIQYYYDTLTNTIKVKADCPDCPEVTITEEYIRRLMVKDSWQEDLGEYTKGFLLGVLALFVVLEVRGYQKRKKLSKNTKDEEHL
jgi:hypothetical protein